MAGELVLSLESDQDLIRARDETRTFAYACGFRALDLTLLATAVSELGRNIIKYARRGEIRLLCMTAGDRRGVRIVAADQGPGLRVADAMRDGYSTGGGLGLGLPGTRRIMDTFEVESAPQKGTTIICTKWASGPPPGS